MSDRYIKFKELSTLIGLGRTTIKQLMKTQWIEGVHFIRYSSRLNLFNKELIQNWLINKHDPAAHQKAVDGFIRSLPQNQAKFKKLNRS